MANKPIQLRITPETFKEEAHSYGVSLKFPSKTDLRKRMRPLDKLEHKIEFTTGILGKVAHSITFYLFPGAYEPIACISIALNKSKEHFLRLKGIKIEFPGVHGGNGEYPMHGILPSQVQIPEQVIFENNVIVNNACWMFEDWPKGASELIVTINIKSSAIPKIINVEEDPEMSEDFLQIPMQAGAGSIMGNLFMNEEFSDFTIICQDKVFPVHRVVLSSRVQYFQAMFTPNMKEAQEGKLTMDDISPTTCEEMLRFIYLGRVENVLSCAHELFVLADKLGMTDLQGLCERYLLYNLNVNNALEFYDLSPALLKKTKDIILSNKGIFIPDVQAFNRFADRHPDLLYELCSAKFTA